MKLAEDTSELSTVENYDKSSRNIRHKKKLFLSSDDEDSLHSETKLFNKKKNK